MPTGEKTTNYAFPQTDSTAFRVWDSVGTVGTPDPSTPFYDEKGYVQTARFFRLVSLAPEEGSEAVIPDNAFGSLVNRDVNSQNPALWLASDVSFIDTIVARRARINSVDFYSVELGFVGDDDPTQQEISRLRDYWLVLEFTVSGTRTAWKFRFGDSVTFRDTVVQTSVLAFGSWTLSDATIINGVVGEPFRAAIYNGEPFPNLVSARTLQFESAQVTATSSMRIQRRAAGNLRMSSDPIVADGRMIGLVAEGGTIVGFPSSAMKGIQSLTMTDTRLVDEAVSRDGIVTTIYDRGGHRIGIQMSIRHDSHDAYHEFDASFAALGRAAILQFPVADLSGVFINSGSDSADLVLSEDIPPGATRLNLNAFGETVKTGHYIQFASRRKIYRVLAVNRAMNFIEIEPGLIARHYSGERILTGVNVRFFMRPVGSISATQVPRTPNVIVSSLRLEEVV